MENNKFASTELDEVVSKINSLCFKGDYKASKTLADVLHLLIDDVAKDMHLYMKETPTILRDLNTSFDSLLNEIGILKRGSLRKDDTREYRDLSIIYDKLSYCANKYKNLYGQQITIMSNENTANNQSLVKIKTENKENVATVTAIYKTWESWSSSQKFKKTSEIVKLAYECRILLESRNRRSGKTTALFNLGKSIPIIVPYDTLAYELNEKFETDLFKGFNQFKVRGYCGEALADELTIEQVKLLEESGMDIVAGFICSNLKYQT